MRARLIRLIAYALVLCFTALPVPFLGLAQFGNDPSSCCDGKDGSCCRRSHHSDHSGPEVTAYPCGTRCHVSVRNITPLAAAHVPKGKHAEYAVSAPAVSVPDRTSLQHSHEPSLYQRPPPAEAQLFT